jgi:hypothetical protein
MIFFAPPSGWREENFHIAILTKIAVENGHNASNTIASRCLKKSGRAVINTALPLFL